MPDKDKAMAVAIDGPAGSGKSTVSRMVAVRLGFTYIDTGAMYRALTLKVMREGTDLADEKSISGVSGRLDLVLLPGESEKEPGKVILDGEDVSEDIRKMEVTVNVKHVCKIPEVRDNLVRLQRKMAASGNGVVMEGRDIGTVVLADARYKFYLDASFDTRVDRRLRELLDKGQKVTRQEVADDLAQRDHSDMTREVGPLIRASDAELVDTTDLSIEDVVSLIAGHIRSGEQRP